jgi:general secretion pathway protein G
MEADKRGFTVMEIFIVAVILCILAAIVVPRISQAKAEGKLSDMVSRLQMIRSQMELYKIQHGDLLPGQEVIAGDITEARFITAMTRKNTVDGYGPYFKKMPENPFITGEVANDITCVNDTNAVPTGIEGTGWWLNAATGQFRACDSQFHTAY